MDSLFSRLLVVFVLDDRYFWFCWLVTCIVRVDDIILFVRYLFVYCLLFACELVASLLFYSIILFIRRRGAS